MKKVLLVLGAVTTAAVGVGIAVARQLGDKAMPQPTIPQGWDRYVPKAESDSVKVTVAEVPKAASAAKKATPVKKAAPAKKAVAKKTSPAKTATPVKKAAPAKKAVAKKAVSPK